MKKTRWQRVSRYLLDRLQESSTWRGLTMILTVGGMALTPVHGELIVMGGLLLSGLIGALFPNTMRKRRQADIYEHINSRDPERIE
jgi:hypothetical protein